MQYLKKDAMKKAINYLKMNPKKGRPIVTESTKSCTVSLKPSEKKELEQKFGSLTKAIKQLLNSI